MSDILPNKLPQNDEELPTSPENILNILKSLNIPYELHHHAAVFTVAEAEKIDAEIPGTHCVNLFLRDKKKKNYLLVLPVDRAVDLKKLPQLLGSARLSFGSNDRLWQYLGVRSGSVCPFAIMNDTDHQVEIFLDQAMMAADIVNYHPLLNNMTVSLTPDDLLKFIATTGHEAHIIDFTAAT